MEKNNTKIWTKYFILIMIAALFTTICVSMLDSTLVLFAVDTWGSKKTGGLLTSFFNAGSILMAFFSGKLVDRYGRRRCFLFAAVLFTLSSLVLAFLPYKAVALTVRFLQGCAKGLVFVAAASIVADIIPQERLGEGMGYYGLAQTLPRALGPVIGLAVISGGNYKLLFLLCALSYFLAGSSVFFVQYESEESHQEKHRTASEDSCDTEDLNIQYRGIWKLIEKKALIPSVVFTLYLFSTAIVLVFLSDYARDVLSISSDRIAYFFTCSTIIGLLMRLVCGKLSDRHGALIVVIPGYCFHILALIILMFFAKDRYILFLIAGLFYGIGNAVVMPVLNSVAVIDSPKGRTSAANAAFYFLMDAGILVASAVMGVIVDSSPDAHDGYMISYYISILGCLIALVLSLLFLNRRAREKRRAS